MSGLRVSRDLAIIRVVGQFDLIQPHRSASFHFLHDGFVVGKQQSAKCWKFFQAHTRHSRR